MHGKLPDFGKKMENSPKKQQNIQNPVSKTAPSPVKRQPPTNKDKLGKSIIQVGERKEPTKNIFDVPRKPSIGQRVKQKLKVGEKKKPVKNIFGASKKPTIGQRVKQKLKAGAGKIKNRISNSFIGKGYRAVVKVVKIVAKIVKGVVKAIVKTVVAAWKATKFVAKTFYKAAKSTGNLVKAAGKGAINLGRKFVKFVKKVGVKGLVVAALAINPSKLVVKFGWRAIKFVGKSIWRGIKKLAFKALPFFGSLFGLMGKFVNKIGYWIGILAHGIVDKTYRFIVKPIASMLVSIFNFVSMVVLSPIQFIKWLIPAVIDRIMDILSNISQMVKSVLKSTWSVFKRILKNPITIAIIVGGLFFILWKWLGPKLSGGISNIKKTIVPMIKSFVSTALRFVTGLWNIIVVVGKTLFTWIEKITHPEGFLAKFIVGVVGTFMAIKRKIKDLMKAAGKNSIDILCMFLSGDLIGMLLSVLAGYAGKFMQWFRKISFMQFITGLVNSILAIGKLIFSLSTLVMRTLMGAVWQLVRGNFKGVVDAITKPWKDVWQQIKDVFSFKAFRELKTDETFLQENPTEKNAEHAKDTNIAVRNLKMKGAGKAEENLAHFNKLQSQLGGAQYGDLLSRIQKMNELYQENSRQVESYDEFISKTWDIGKGGEDIAQQLLKQMLESPDISQKLLSVFFYYNPQTGETQMLWPSAYISGFLDNIRKMMSQPDRKDSEAFKTIIQAFEQLNVERSHIINNQGKVIADFSDKLANYDKQKDKDGKQEGEIKDIIKTFNTGDLFSAATSKESFEQMVKGEARTKRIESVTGAEFGTNSLFPVMPAKKASDGKVVVKDSDFVMPKKAKEPPSRDTMGNVVLPPGSNPKPEVDVVDDKSMGDLWREHQAKRNNYLNKGHTDAQAHAVGLDDMTLDQFKQNYKKMHPKSPEQLEKEETNRNKRAAALRNAKMI